MHGLGSKTVARMPNEYTHYRLWLRNISYQQFFYQSAFNGSAFARQSLLFDKLPSNHSFRAEFLKATGIPLSDFFELSAILLARFMTDKNSSIDSSWFSPVTHRYSATVIQKFLDIFSCDLLSLRKHLNFLLIITLKELYLGNGTDFYDSAAKNKIDALIGNSTSPPIPLENIYFLTVDDLDHFANCVNKGEVRFIDFIRQAVKKDIVASSKKFHFRQHLSEIGTNISPPQYLDEEIDGIFRRVEHLLLQT
jgi:hypothetical protein